MPSSSIAQILLRLFALNWFISGLVELASVGFAFRQEYFDFYLLSPSLIYFVSGILVWAIAPKLSRFLAHRNDGEFNFKGVTEQQLYAAVFLGLGLYFTLTSFASAFNWAHFFTTNRSPDFGFHQESQPSYYDMSETGLTLAGGLLLIFTCNIWARKLARNPPSGSAEATASPEST